MEEKRPKTFIRLTLGISALALLILVLALSLTR